jgi:hypothetical protein
MYFKVFNFLNTKAQPLRKVIFRPGAPPWKISRNPRSLSANGWPGGTAGPGPVVRAAARGASGPPGLAR